MDQLVSQHFTCQVAKFIDKYDSIIDLITGSITYESIQKIKRIQGSYDLERKESNSVLKELDLFHSDLS